MTEQTENKPRGKGKKVSEHGYVRLNITAANFEKFGVEGNMLHGQALEKVRETLKANGLELIGTTRSSKYAELKGDLKLEGAASKDDIIAALLAEREAKGKK